MMTLTFWTQTQQIVEDYYCPSFKSFHIPIRGFRFIVLTYTPTHCDKVIAIPVLPYYVTLSLSVLTAIFQVNLG